MVALSVTATQVLKGSSAIIEQGLAGATITAGQAVYKDTGVTPNKWKLADADLSAAAAGLNGVGIALNGAADGQPIDVQTGGNEFTIGAAAAPAAGTIYCVGATAGTVVPDTDIASGDYVVTLGVGDGTSKIVGGIKYTGVQHA